MKNKNLKKSLLLVSVVLLALPNIIYAYYDSNLGSIGNPLQVQITPSPSQQYDQSMSEWNARLQQQSLTNSINSATYLQSQQQQTLQAQLRYQQTLQNKVICSTSAATLKNGICVPNNQICTDSYGINSIWPGTYNAKGGPICGCKSGYTFNNKTCISDDQSCGISYPNSVFSSLNADGVNFICGCPTGYAWNNQRTSCVVDVSQPKNTVSDIKQKISSLSDQLDPLNKSLKKEVESMAPQTQNISNIDKVIPENKKDPSISTSDIKQVDKKGILIKSTALTSCPSVTCDIVRYYAETSELNIIEEYKNGDWYKIKTENNTGWINSNSFDKNSIVETSLPNLNLATSSIPKSEPQASKSFWQILKGWFSFGK